MTGWGSTEKKRAYEALPIRRAYKQAYDSRPERKAYKKIYNSRPSVIVYKRAFRARADVKQQEAEYEAKSETTTMRIAYRQRIRSEVLTAYGGRCACCGESEHRFLAIDHVNGGGTKHRKILGGGTMLYRWLKKQGFPVGFQLLCHNCNSAKAYYSACPHEARRQHHEPHTPNSDCEAARP